MVVAFVVEVTVMIATLVMVLPQLTVTSECLVTSAPAMFMAYWIASLAFEAFLFTLTVFKFALSVSSGDREHSVLTLFMRDGTWAFAMIFGAITLLYVWHVSEHPRAVAMVLNLFLYKVVTTPLVGIGSLCVAAMLHTHAAYSS